MELLEGQTLKHRISGKAHETELVLDLGVQIADPALFEGWSRPAVAAVRYRGISKVSLIFLHRIEVRVIPQLLPCTGGPYSREWSSGSDLPLFPYKYLENASLEEEKTWA